MTDQPGRGITFGCAIEGLVGLAVVSIVAIANLPAAVRFLYAVTALALFLFFMGAMFVIASMKGSRK